MKQLLLDIDCSAPAGFEHFVAGDNAALLAALHEAALAGSDPLYLWGPHGSGKSHLLAATAALAREAGRPSRRLPSAPSSDGTAAVPTLLIVDDVDGLSATQQIALFNAFNACREHRSTLIVAGSAPPRDLALREDLRTRIGQALVFEIRPPDDDVRRAIIESLADRRGIRLDGEVVGFVLRHGNRDMASLLSVFEALDRASLENKRPITLPLLRSLVQSGLDI
ncbi:MAG: DnaA regulatory inactivator Hda [Zoogloeaceae bacterium]|nr:DnaA regulatory inactivator Hda [Rhodocyclaceae bacterium]MCP5237496.1 DnaA regulatory inactivator Hda [Zoogloeaceae bacterium]